MRLQPGSRAAALYGVDHVSEDYFCRYGLNPAFRAPLERSGLRVSGVDDQDEVRIVELDDHPFFMATLFCFQTRSRPGAPHPLVTGLVDAAREAPRPPSGVRA